MKKAICAISSKSPRSAQMHNIKKNKYIICKNACLRLKAIHRRATTATVPKTIVIYII